MGAAKQSAEVTKYAIVDIETTGGHAAMHRIIEIAIVVTDGTNVLDTYETLIDPGMPIPYHITGLTGINDNDVAGAPTFDNVAHKIYDMLDGCVFVAHNVNFDYSFVKNELAQCRYTFSPRKLCTVRLSRKVFPGYRSYSLGTLCSALGIDIKNRHRAMGDAYATYEVLVKLLKEDTKGAISTALKGNSREQTLPPNLPKEQFETLPQAPGVYYFHDEHGKIIYVGKAINIRQRVSTHFTGNIKGLQRQSFMREIHSISHELTGNELVALLLETNEIHTHWPKYNRAQKKPEFNYGIFEYLGNDGYLRLAIDRLRKLSHPAARFDTIQEATTELQHLVMAHKLCPAKCSLRTIDNEKMACKEKCSCQKTHADYNKLVAKALATLTDEQTNMVVVAAGRTPEEKAVILFKDGQFKGYGFADAQTISIDTPEEYIKPMKHYGFANKVVHSFISAQQNTYLSYKL